MAFLKIEKCGIDNVVDEGQYEAIYKPLGWKIVEEQQAREVAGRPHDEIETKNLNKMKRQTAKRFDDGLLKD